MLLDTFVYSYSFITLLGPLGTQEINLCFLGLLWGKFLCGNIWKLGETGGEGLVLEEIRM